LIEEGRAGMPKMMSVGLHCRLAQPGRTAGLAEFVEFARKHHDVWICTREEIADFWHENHYPRGEGSPVKTERDQEPMETDNIDVPEQMKEEEEGDII
jgi:hypothetical protein